MRDIRPSADGRSPERSIRNIPLQHRKARPQVIADHTPETDGLPPDGPTELPRRRPRRSNNRFWLWAFVVVLVCGIMGVLLSTVFAGATVTVNPRTEQVSVPPTITAMLNAPVGTLTFELLAVSRGATTTVAADGTQRVSRAASGVITISNTYSKDPQRLIANTRFATADSKIYRIRDSVVVPGMQGTTPGSATATVYADSPGAEYNKPSNTTFTIPGFKGDPRFDKFNAVATNGITGGFVGEEPAVATADLASAKQALQKQLDTAVRTAAAAEIPEGYRAVPGTLNVSYGDVLQTSGGDKKALLSQTATARGAIVRDADLASAIGRARIQGYGGEAVAFGTQNGMSIQATSSKPGDNTITLALAGEATLVWQFDPNALRQALVGKGKDELQTVIKAFEPAVAKASVMIRPFWQGKFPSEADKIQIKVEGAK